MSQNLNLFQRNGLPNPPGFLKKMRFGENLNLWESIPSELVLDFEIKMHIFAIKIYSLNRTIMELRLDHKVHGENRFP